MDTVITNSHKYRLLKDANDFYMYKLQKKFLGIFWVTVITICANDFGDAVVKAKEYINPTIVYLN